MNLFENWEAFKQNEIDQTSILYAVCYWFALCLYCTKYEAFFIIVGQFLSKSGIKVTFSFIKLKGNFFPIVIWAL